MFVGPNIIPSCVACLSASLITRVLHTRTGMRVPIGVSSLQIMSVIEDVFRLRNFMAQQGK